MNRFGWLAAGLTVWLAAAAGAFAATPDPADNANDETSTPAEATANGAGETEQPTQPAAESPEPPVEEIDPRTMYLEERLYLTLRDAPGGEGDRVGLLKSGDRLTQTARRDGYARVETPDGTVGWVAARFLTEETPAGARLEQAQQEADTLRRQLKQARQTLADTRKELAETKEQLEAARQRADAASQGGSGAEPDNADPAGAESGTAILENRIEELEAALTTARDRSDRLETARSGQEASITGDLSPARIGILGGLFGLAFGLGVAAGVRWHSKRTRERLGGLKL